MGADERGGTARPFACPPAGDPHVLLALQTWRTEPLFPFLEPCGPGEARLSPSQGPRGGWWCRSPWAARGSGFSALEFSSHNFPELRRRHLFQLCQLRELDCGAHTCLCF